MKLVVITIIMTGLMPEMMMAQPDNSLSLSKAIQIAEQYIRINGFTNEVADTTKMSAEFLYDDGMSKSAVAAKRKNTLHPKAFCRSEHGNEWHIGFLSTKVNLDKLTPEQKNQDLPGKGVIIAKDLSEIRMAHKKVLFSKWIKL